VEFPAALAIVDAGLAAALVPDLALPPALEPATRVADLPGLGARTISAYIQRTRRLAPLVQTALDALRTTGTGSR
jgi:DNA-binding transcriptional LysR family regulator